MTIDIVRRRTLLSVAAIPFLPACASIDPEPTLAPRFAALERDLQGRLGVAALDTANGRLIAHRADERFAMCSTFKMMASAAVLARSVADPNFLLQKVRYTKDDLVTYSPVTEKHTGDGMTLEELCAATMITSDNTAANLILRQIGGPEGLTRFARGIDDQQFRLDRLETELNSAIPGDPRDTTTPRAMMQSLRALVLGNALPPAQRQKLKQWMIDCETGGKTIRAGVPAHWVVGEKTGSGGYGSRNDIGVAWPPGRGAVVMAIYTTRDEKGAASRDDIVAAAARIVAGRM